MPNQLKDARLADHARLPEPTAPLRSFLEGLRLDHGPIPEIARFLMAAESVVRATGITLSFASIRELVDLQERNEVSWPLLAPWMSAKFAPLDDDNSYCLLGRSAQGRVVASQAGRIYRLGETSLAEIVADQSMIYGKPHVPVGNEPHITLTAPVAQQIRGTIVYSGGLWVAPDYRGHKLASLLPRMSRAYALGRFNTETTYCVVSEQIAASPLFAMYGYSRRQPGFSLYEGNNCFYTASLLWMPAQELVADMNTMREQLVAEIDRAISAGRRNDVTRAVG
jgi:GNAT superfamily N-acetyltransferase